jgi:hypothetical protein
MKPRHIIPALATCFSAHAAETAANAIITDPSQIVDSTTHDLGDRLLTVQQVTENALPMPETLPPQVVQPTSAPASHLTPHQETGFFGVGATIYRRSGQPSRSLVQYRPQGSDQVVSFWSSADWSLIAPVSSLTDANGKNWMLMCMHSIQTEDDATAIPNFPAGKSTIKVVSGDPQLLAPVQLFLDYYDANLPELQAAYQARLEEQQRRAAEESEKPKDIVVQYRTLAPEEIVPVGSTPKISEK